MSIPYKSIYTVTAKQDAVFSGKQDYMDNNLALAIVENRAHKYYMHHYQAWQYLIDTHLAFELGEPFITKARNIITLGYCTYDKHADKQYLLSRPLQGNGSNAVAKTPPTTHS